MEQERVYDFCSGFEIEEEDTSIAGTNFYTIQPNATVDSAGVGTAATYITPGDTYLFRIRADHTDGSVSAYVQSDPVTLTLADAPELSVKTITVDEGYGPFQEIEVGWSGIADIADATGISVDVMSSAIPGSGWSHVNDGDIENGSITFPIYAESPDPESGSGNTGFTIDPGVFGASTYTYRIQAFYSNGDVSAWSAPESAAIDGGPGPAPTLSTSGTTITASWAASDGPDALLMNQDGLPGNTLLGGGEILPIQQGQLNQAGDTYTAVMGNLTPGTQYDFSLWTPVYEGNGQVLETFGDASITVGGTAPVAPPAAPAGAEYNLQFAPSPTPVSGNVVNLAWTNGSNNETGFVVERQDSSGAITTIGSTGADATTFTDTGMTPDNYQYFVIPINGGNSAAQQLQAGNYKTISVPVWPPGYLEALDGTRDTAADNTLINRFKNDYKRSGNYVAGVSWLVQITGAQLQQKFQTAYLDVAQEYQSQSNCQNVPLDIVGYSRGAFTAEELAYVATQIGIPNLKVTDTVRVTVSGGKGHGNYIVTYHYHPLLPYKPKLRYLGLISPVGQTTIASELLSFLTWGVIQFNPGWNTSLPANFQVNYNDWLENGILPQQGGATVPAPPGDTHVSISQDKAVERAMWTAANGDNVPIPKIPSDYYTH